ncbi:MAG: ribonuclease HII [Balneola sp.]|nr:MAG: ribonuclease HII [Balneola sp.]
MDRTKYEKQLWSEGFERIMGLDEVGRGCLAGPVVAAGVIFESGTEFPEIRDSKKIDKSERERLADEIKKRALFWSVEEGSIADIDRLNILWASIATMESCANKEGAAPDYLLVDGNRYSASLIPFTCVVKGDDKSISIGAASILAKVYRDNLMEALNKDFPEFGWDSNVGYPTKHHREALRKYGYTRHHRLSFNLGTDKKYK